MKKIIAGLTLALMVVAIPVGLVGCKKTNLVGKYEFETITWTQSANYHGTAPEEGELEEQIAMLKELGCYIQLNKDGTAVFYNFMGEGEQVVQWKKDGKKLDFYQVDEGGTEHHLSDVETGMSITYKNNKIYFTMAMEAEQGNASSAYVFKK